MIKLTVNVDNISTVIQFYDQIAVSRSSTQTGTFATVSGVGPVSLVAGTSLYTVTDDNGLATDWYKTRYENSATLLASSWSEAVIGSASDLYYNPLYPEEVPYSEEDKLIVARIRRLIGDPVRLRRDYGADDLSGFISDDCKVYELPERGWPVNIVMNGVVYSDGDNPVVNGYRYLQFPCTISGCVNCRGEDVEVDVWYYNFRHSDREIIEAYDNCPPPPGLSTTTATSEHYMLQSAIDLLMMENWEYSGEDGAKISDEGTNYDPSPGFTFRNNLLKQLQKRLDDMVKISIMSGIEGVLLD